MAAPNPGMYTPQVNAPEPRMVAPRAANIADNGLQAVAQGIDNVGDSVMRVQMQDAAVHASNAMASARSEWTQQMIDRQLNYKTGDDLTGQVAKDFDAYKAKVLATAPKVGQKNLNAQLTNFGASLSQNAMQFQAKAQVEGRITTWNEGVEKAKIAVSVDPTQFEEAYHEQLSSLNALQIDQNTKNTLASRLKADMAYNASEAWAKRDPAGVIKQLQKETTGNPALDRLSVEQRGQIENFANAEIRQREADSRKQSNELAANTKARITDLSASYRAGLPVDPKQELSATQIESAFPGQGFDLWKDLQKDKRMGMDLKDMGQMSPRELIALKDRYAVKEGGEGAQDALLRQKEVNDAFDISKKQRESDPRKFAIENSLSQPINFNDPQSILSELSSRAANTPRVAAQVGVMPPLLSREETKQFSTLLDNATPQQKTQWLGALATKLGPSYQSLMEQVLPDNPVSAIVGSQIGHLHAQTPAQWFDFKFAGDPTGPEKILAGEKLLNNKEENVKFPMPPEHNNSETGMRDYFAKKTDTLFRDRPQLGEATYAAYRAAYAGLLAESGDFKGTWKRDLGDKALQMSIGKLDEFNGKTIAIPQGMDPSKFKNMVKGSVLATAQAAGAPKDFEDRIDGYQLRETGSVGSGRYQLIQGNAPLVRPDGKGFFIIDLRQQYGEK